MVGNSNSPSSTRRRSVSKLRAVAIAPMAAEALGTIAISSAVAPIDVATVARSRSTSPTQRSHGEPCVSHDVVNASRAALTSTDNAPWEQLFT